MKKLLLLLFTITTAHASTFTAFAPQKLGTSTLDIAQAQHWGSVRWSGTTNCLWDQNTTGSWISMPQDLDCDNTARTKTGTYNSTDIGVGDADGSYPQIKFSQIPAGTLKCTATGRFYRGTLGQTNFRFYDGTTGSASNSIYDGGADIAVNTIIGEFHYSSDQTAETTIIIQAWPITNAGRIIADSSDEELEISCTHFPSAQNSFRTTCSGLECENEFGAKVAAANTVSDETTDWIDGNAAITDTSLFTFTLTSGLFGVAPKCDAQVIDGSVGQASQAKVVSTSTSSVVVRTGYTTAASNFTKQAFAFHLECDRSGSDYNQMDKRFIPVVDPSDVLVEGISNSGQSITTNVTPIPFTEVIDTDSAWDGDTFTVPAGKGGEYSIKGIINGSAAFQNVELYKNGTLIRYNAANSLQFRPFNFEETLNPGDTVHLRINLSGNVVASTTLHHIRIRRLKSELNAFIGNLTPAYIFKKSIRTTDYNQASPTINTWYVPDTSWKLTLTEGTWKVNVKGYMLNATTCSTGNQIVARVALSTSTTPGSEIIGSDYGMHNACFSTNIFTSQSFDYTPEETVTVGAGATKDIYVHMRYTGWSGTPTVSALTLYAASGSGFDPVITAEKVE